MKKFSNALEINNLSNQHSVSRDKKTIVYSGLFQNLDESIKRYKILKRETTINIILWRKQKHITFVLESQIYVPYKAIYAATYIANNINSNLLIGHVGIKKSGHITYNGHILLPDSGNSKRLINYFIKSIIYVLSRNVLDQFTSLIDKESADGNSIY